MRRTWHRDRRPRRRPEHDRALRLGARPGEARVRRAQALVLTHLKDLTVAGAGMAGLVAAARARELGASPVVLRKGQPAGRLDAALQRRRVAASQHRRLSPQSARAATRHCSAGSSTSSTTRSTGSSRSGRARSRSRPATLGPSGVATTHAHSPTCSSGQRGTYGWRRPSRRQRCSRPAASARASRASAGCSCVRTRGARARGSTTRSRRGAAASEGMDEFYGRALPGEVPENEFVSASQLYARHALVLDDTGADLGEAAWHESDIVQRFPGGVAWYVVDAAALGRRTPYGTVADAIEVARAAGGDVRPADELPFALPASPKLVTPPFTAVRVHAAVTHTIGGLRVDERARVLDAAGDAGRRLARGGRRRGRHLHRRLRQRPRRCARLRPHRCRDGPRLNVRRRSGELGESAAAPVARQRRRADLADPKERLAVLDRRADRRRLALALLQRPAARRPDEQDVAGTVVTVLVRHRGRILEATDARCTKETRRGSTCLRVPARPRSGR